MMAMLPEQLHQTAERWRGNLGQGEVISGKSTIGGGSLPEESLPTFLLALDVKSPDRFLEALRGQNPPIIARTENDRILLDPRTIMPDEEVALLEGLVSALREQKGSPNAKRG
jgi:L-seryl-tRNA(Ser) seleniumtransferase